MITNINAKEQTPLSDHIQWKEMKSINDQPFPYAPKKTSKKCHVVIILRKLSLCILIKWIGGPGYNSKWKQKVEVMKKLSDQMTISPLHYEIIYLANYFFYSTHLFWRVIVLFWNHSISLYIMFYHEHTASSLSIHIHRHWSINF